MRKGKVKQPKLVPFRCSKCGRLIVWTLPRARAWCTECKRWVEAGEAEALKDKAAGDSRR
ncbi:MAG: hypothetical protein HPY90_07685 [Syntrophothermus sp.]|uniref:hypothetical protein n=1 Tax=Syntrophothermus sp. TaxID=2736299 RepID=UPI00258054F7|nr:hypothetical protein [Syntrophothermus sp.]NSW83142.1 hypothetical protein [Syntrophothermus sp.]